MNTNDIFRISQTQIGKTLYTVKALPSEKATETAEQKLVRLVRERIAEEIKSGETPAFDAEKPCLSAVSPAHCQLTNTERGG